MDFLSSQMKRFLSIISNRTRKRQADVLACMEIVLQEAAVQLLQENPSSTLEHDLLPKEEVGSRVWKLASGFLDYVRNSSHGRVSFFAHREDVVRVAREFPIGLYVKACREGFLESIGDDGPEQVLLANYVCHGGEVVAVVREEGYIEDELTYSLLIHVKFHRPVVVHTNDIETIRGLGVLLDENNSIQEYIFRPSELHHEHL